MAMVILIGGLLKQRDSSAEAADPDTDADADPEADADTDEDVVEHALKGNAECAVIQPERD
uniref:GG17218 n=1 Tax=Drosophila erecta TaxID=7220 RepID=B3NZE1_DROER